MKTPRILLATLVALSLTQSGRAQVIHPGVSASVPHVGMSSVHVIVPQARHFARRGAGSVEVSEVRVGVEILEQVATTTMDIHLTNAAGTRLEARLVVPVPEEVALRGFTFLGNAPEAKAELLTKEEARRTYDAIVARTRDPALLEFVGCNLIQSSVFPVEAGSGQKVRIVYEHLLTADGDRVDYFLPRTESIDYRVPWKISVQIRSKTPIGTVYSPSHRLDTTRASETHLSARLSADATTEPGPFRLSYLLQRNGVTASLLAYPDPKIGGGYFLLLASVPAKAPAGGGAVSKTAGAPGLPMNERDAAPRVKREVILVLDRSGSMAGEKLEQVRAAALQVLEGLEDGERFNILVYNEAVESFSPQPVVKNSQTMRAAREYLGGLRVRGGTNIHDALLEALRMQSTEGCLPIVLFLTDGLPTVGQTSEKAIRDLVLKGNPCERRVFTFGVGVDVNAPLLDRLALDTRAASTFVLPKEDVEVKVGQVFQRLCGPVLAGPKLEARDGRGGPALGRVREVTPAPLPDLFQGDQLIVLGQYVRDEPLDFTLAGNYFGKQRTFQFHFNLDKATTRNAFVPRLWASRKLAVLTDAIRDLGADSAFDHPTLSAHDPRAKELVEEIVRLSREFGVLTEYTAFLAREGTDLARPADLVVEAQRNFHGRAQNTRTGWGAMNQALNLGAQRFQSQLNTRNDFYDANMQRVQVSAVQQVNDRAFYRRGNRWVDSALVGSSDAAPRRVVTVGSDEFRQLVERLADQNRQGTIALDGEILLRLDGETILVK